MRDEIKVMAKEKIQRTLNWNGILQQIKENPNSHNTLAQAHVYIGEFPSKVQDVVSEYQKLDLEKEQDLHHALSLQSLYSASQSEHGQKELIKTMDHHATIQQAIINSMVLEQPSDELVEKLKTLSTLKEHPGLDEESLLDVNINAYYALAHSASKLPLEKSQHILSHIVDNLEKAKTIQEFEKEIHALANLGEIAPIETLAIVADNEHLPLTLRSAAILGLGKRVAEFNKKEVTNILHHLMEKDHHEHVRTLAVMAQTRREEHLQEGHSVEHLIRYLEDTHTPATMVQAIKEYYHEEQSERAHNILQATKLSHEDHIGERTDAVKVMSIEGYFEDERFSDVTTLEAKSLWWRAAGNWFRRAASTVSNGFRRAVNVVRTGFVSAGRWIRNTARIVGNAIVNGATWLYNRTVGAMVKKVKDFINKLKEKFSKAQFHGQKVCVQTNSQGEQLCLFDADMVQFVRKQGDLTHMRWSKQFEFETLIGVEIMHAYIGALGYAGTRIDCADNELDISIFGRGSAKVSAFSRNIPILTVELELSKFGSNPLNDKAYIGVLTGTLYNGHFIPEKVRKIIDTCGKFSRPIVKPHKKQLLKWDFFIMAGFVPLDFHIALVGYMGVDLVNIICPFRLTLTVSVEPYVGIGISASANIGVAVLRGGVKAEFDSEYRLQPGFGTSNCNLCVVLRHKITPITITISLEAHAFTFGWNQKIYSWRGPVIDQLLFKRCLFPNKPYNPESVLNGPYSPPSREDPLREDPSREDPPTDISNISNEEAQCYLDRYPDLQRAFGIRNINAAKNHWNQYGFNEKRDKSCPIMTNQQAQCYLDRYPDLQRAFGPNNIAAAEQHWKEYGFREKRNKSCNGIALVPAMTNEEAQCYLDRYPDLQRAFGIRNINAAKNHWNQYGYGEKRDKSCPLMTDRQAQCYLNRYIDLQNAFGPNNIGAAKRHWKEYGFREKRNKSCNGIALVPAMTNEEAQCYLDRYPDLQRAFGIRNINAAKNHWNQYGYHEKRDKSCPIMTNQQAQCYLDRYPDLQRAFGPNNIAAAEQHWKEYGFREKRNKSCNGIALVPAMTNEEAQCYLDRYPDLQRAFGIRNIIAAKNHWNQYGYHEKRDKSCPIMTNQQAQCYLDRYPDLQRAFGPNNIAAAEQHWKEYGFREKRNKSCN